MQKYCTELTDRLLKSLDKEYNVVDMGAVVDVITALEKTNITKEVLEITRLGKYINEFRRKTSNDALAKRAKDLVRKWRDMVLPSSHATTVSHPLPSIPHDTTSYQTINGTTKPLSPAARIVKPRSPVATRIIKPQSPLLRDVITSMKVLSPALSLNSDHSHSPSLTPMKQLPTSMIITNSRVNSSLSPLLSGTNQNHSIEAVPRTHSSNKRLRKDENVSQLSPMQSQQQQQCDMGFTLKDESSIAKKARVNGDNMNISINSQVPSSPSLTLRDKNSLESITNSEVDTGPKKRGRKKGSKSLKNQPLPEDRVKEKLASMARNPKLKTTQELLADLQARGSNVASSGSCGVSTVGQSAIDRRTTEPPTTEEILRNPTEFSNHGLGDGDGAANTADKLNRMKFTQSNSSKRRGESRVSHVGSIQLESVPTNSTVEEILAKLPPLDLDSIKWSDDDDDDEAVRAAAAATNGDGLIDKNTDGVECQRRQINDHDVDRLHQDCIEGLNGNYESKVMSTDRKEEEKQAPTELSQNTTEAVKKILDVYKRRITSDNGTDCEFREWHEMLARPSYDGQILHILPYVIID